MTQMFSGKVESQAVASPTITFLLNDRLITYTGPNSRPLVDVIRSDHHLCATKTGCREGDCGACTVLLGEILGEQMTYKAVTSCIYPVGNAQGKHVLSLEGLTPDQGLNPVQDAFVSSFATQCGFCTPGFIVSLCGAVLNSERLEIEELKSAIDGNLCRCTGYHSIVRALEKLIDQWADPEHLSDMKRSLLCVEPEWVLEQIKSIPKINDYDEFRKSNRPLGGGTDLLVQEGYPHRGVEPQNHPLIEFQPGLQDVKVTSEFLYLGAGLTVAELMEDDSVRRFLPELVNFSPLISSTQIRHEATLGGNLVNASPIADFAMVFLALGADLELIDSDGRERLVPLDSFFKGYKILDLKDGEWIRTIRVPKPWGRLNFEKVSKRKILDIASVNGGIQVDIQDQRIQKILLSVGGVAPIPMRLKTTEEFLEGKDVTLENIKKAAEITMGEVTPISDIRGEAHYKKSLAGQFLFAHFLALAPNCMSEEDLWSE